MKKIFCENELCIYQEKNRCLLRKVDIGEVGICTDCIQVQLDATELKNRKKKALDRLEKI